MTRIEALERVAEAARAWLNVVAQLPYQDQRELDAMSACESALNNYYALDALPPAAPEPVGELVEVRGAVVRNPHSGLMHLSGSQNKDGKWVFGTKNAIATIRARVPLPVVPEVVGEVEG